MAVMTAQQRRECAAAWMVELSSIFAEVSGVTKADMRAAVNAIDQYLSDNAATINTALPVAVRTNLTVNQKARLLRAVVAKRYLTGN